MSSSDRTHELEYAPRVASEVRRGHLRRVTRVVFALAISTVLIAAVVRTVRQYLYLRVQRECMTYLALPETIVFDGVRARSAAPASATQFLSDANPLVFIHERQTPAGETRLVFVAISHNPTEVFLYGEQFVPATLMLKSKIRHVVEVVPLLPIPNRARIFAGQPDPNDPTHFTIDYELEGQRNTVDGWLLNDGPVKLEPRGHGLETRATLEP